MSASRRGLGTKKLKRVTRLLPLYWMGLAFRGSGFRGLGFRVWLRHGFQFHSALRSGFRVWGLGFGGSELK